MENQKYEEINVWNYIYKYLDKNEQDVLIRYYGLDNNKKKERL